MKALIGITLLLFTFSASSSNDITFWDTPQHGGNSFNRLPPTQAYYEALRGYKLKVTTTLREKLVLQKWPHSGLS